MKKLYLENVPVLPFQEAPEVALEPTVELIEELREAIRICLYKKASNREKAILKNIGQIELQQHYNGAYKTAWIYDKTGEGFQMVINKVIVDGIIKHMPGDITN